MARSWGVWVALGMILGFASTAEAQITVTTGGPGCIESDDTSFLYQSTTTTNYDFEHNLKIYRNSVLKHSSINYIVNDGPSYNYQETVNCSLWGLATGDRVMFRVKCTIMEGPYLGTYATDSDTVTVSAPGTCYAEPRRLERTGVWA